jgi:hypothetical protein
LLASGSCDDPFHISFDNLRISLSVEHFWYSFEDLEARLLGEKGLIFKWVASDLANEYGNVDKIIEDWQLTRMGKAIRNDLEVQVLF